MRCKIIQIKSVTGSSLVYVDVEFLELGVVVHHNDFIMQIPAERRYYDGPRDAEGRPTSDDPQWWVTEDSDAVGIIRDNILAYIGRLDLQVHVFDRRDPSIETDNSDPLGLLARPGVAALVGVEWEGEGR